MDCFPIVFPFSAGRRNKKKSPINTEGGFDIERVLCAILI